MIRWIFLVVVVSSVGATAVTGKTAGGQAHPVEATDSSYYYQAYPGQYHGYTNGYNYGNNYVQKQDFGNPSGGGDDAFGAVGTGLGVTALVVAVLVLIALAVPTILAIAAIIYTAIVANDGLGGMIGMKGSSDSSRGLGSAAAQRSISALKSFIQSENCIERISCTIGRRTVGARRGRGAFKKMNKAEYFDNTSENMVGGQKQSSLVQRISRAFNEDDCAAYKCSLFSYF